MTNRARVSRYASFLSVMMAAAPAFAAQAQVGNGIVVHDLVAVPPTLISGGVDLKIDGDDNRNATARVEYRKAGEAQWRKGLDLFRLKNEDVNAWPDGDATARRSGSLMKRPPLPYDIPNMFSGSVFNLEPGTAYEVRVTVSDPDGVQGNAVQTAQFTTRKEPRPAEGGKVYHVYPWNHQGPKIEPAFTGLLAAYYLEARHADWSNAAPIRVVAGDTILVHAGEYKDNRQHYNDGVEGETEARLGTPFDGTYYLLADGTADKPITIKAAGDGEVIFDGNGNAVLFNVMGGDYNYFEGITVRNTEVGFLTGLKNIAGANGFTLKNSRIENVGRGVQGDWEGARDYYIADNVFLGRHSRTALMGWTNAWKDIPGFPEKISGPNGSEYAVKIYGSGHVVAYNDVRHWHDGLDFATFGAPEKDEKLLPMSNDIYGNYLNAFGDNCIEADGGTRNMRVFDNICFNAVGGAYSSQTIFGGPAYFIRNVAVSGVGLSAKFSFTPSGVMHINNTYIGEHHDMAPVSNVHFLNNLFIAHGMQGSKNGFGVKTYTNYSSSDHNGFQLADSFENKFNWSSPADGIAVDYRNHPILRSYATLKDYARGTGRDRNSITFDVRDFVKFTMPDSADPTTMYPVTLYDLRLKKGSRAIDKGKALDNISDGFRGSAPDLGAYEFGAPLPHYGPRQ